VQNLGSEHSLVVPPVAIIPRVLHYLNVQQEFLATYHSQKLAIRQRICI
jgi:hypothetical protein